MIDVNRPQPEMALRQRHTPGQIRQRRSAFYAARPAATAYTPAGYATPLLRMKLRYYAALHSLLMPPADTPRMMPPQITLPAMPGCNSRMRPARLADISAAFHCFQRLRLSRDAGVSMLQLDEGYFRLSLTPPTLPPHFASQPLSASCRVLAAFWLSAYAFAELKHLRRQACQPSSDS
jgi:hypothetical protein